MITFIARAEIGYSASDCAFLLGDIIREARDKEALAYRLTIGCADSDAQIRIELALAEAKRLRATFAAGCEVLDSQGPGAFLTWYESWVDEIWAEMEQAHRLALLEESQGGANA